MTHDTTGTVLAFPERPGNPAPSAPPIPDLSAVLRIDAHRVFGHHVRPGHRGWLWTVELDGVEYLTDRHVTIRRDRLTGVDGHRFDTLEFPPDNIARVLEALAAPLAGTPTTARFAVDILAALFDVGAGVLPLAGDLVPDTHAVMFCAQRIGLVTPIPAWRAAHALGAIPGVPPSAADVDWWEVSR
ncbi:hypothetical protein [Kribbella sp. CA-247076]|uniref:hypothetical protein n=1 Tax=Kribbella sp. CA-247076 TaxID=3239941 RepID=UPI003D91386F